MASFFYLGKLGVDDKLAVWVVALISPVVVLVPLVSRVPADSGRGNIQPVINILAYADSAVVQAGNSNHFRREE